MKKMLLIPVLTLTAALVTTVATAEPDEDTISPAFKLIDADHDGMISKSEAEVSQTLPPVFDQADANKDGMLDTAEFARIEFQERRQSAQ